MNSMNKGAFYIASGLVVVVVISFGLSAFDHMQNVEELQRREQFEFKLACVESGRNIDKYGNCK